MGEKQDISSLLSSIAKVPDTVLNISKHFLVAHQTPDKISPSSPFCIMNRLRLRKINNFLRLTELMNAWAGLWIRCVWPLSPGPDPDHVQAIKLYATDKIPSPLRDTVREVWPSFHSWGNRAQAVKCCCQGHALESGRADVQNVSASLSSQISLSGTGGHSKQIWGTLFLP